MVGEMRIEAEEMLTINQEYDYEMKTFTDQAIFSRPFDVKSPRAPHNISKFSALPEGGHQLLSACAPSSMAHTVVGPKGPL